MNEALICDAIRTPISRYGRAFAAVRPDDLAALTFRTLGVGQGIAVLLEAP
jgi:acetyl-CoA acyltransferase